VPVEMVQADFDIDYVNERIESMRFCHLSFVICQTNCVRSVVLAFATNSMIL
jgi:hypothetical protein